MLEKIRAMAGNGASISSITTSLNISKQTFNTHVRIMSHNYRKEPADAYELGLKDYQRTYIYCGGCDDEYRNIEDKKSIKKFELCTYCYEQRKG